jgi:hypothetical protein
LAKSSNPDEGEEREQAAETDAGQGHGVQRRQPDYRRDNRKVGVKAGEDDGHQTADLDERE